MTQKKTFAASDCYMTPSSSSSSEEEEEEETLSLQLVMELQTHHHLAQVPAEVLAHVLQGCDSTGPEKKAHTYQVDGSLVNAHN